MDLDVLVVGAGFSGLYALHRLRGAGFAVRVVERGDGVGGTWFWNRYPGARCDIESVDYSYSGELREGWTWTERYAAQPEILAYLEHVADRFDLRRDIALRTEVTGARWDEELPGWHVTTDDGATTTARHLVLAVGNLTKPKPPALPGLEDFAGEWHHTARWPREGVELAGRRVAVLGTGSTGIQATTAIAGRARHLAVLQRTPNYSMPARNRPLAPGELEAVNATYAERRKLAEHSDAGVPLPPAERAAADADDAERRAAYEEGWRRGGINALSAAFNDLFTSEEANRSAQDFAREQIRAVVHDPATADALSPAHHIGTKRTCVDTGYFEVFNRDDVELVDLRREPIDRVTADGIRLEGGRELPLDLIVVATGFDAMTGAITALDVRGHDGVTLCDRWADGPRTHLGLAVAGFPNLFLVTGPGSPGVLSNMVVSIEQHVDWIAACLEGLRDRGATRIEATPEAEDAWVRHVADLAEGTLYPAASSWYLGANIPGKPRIFMPYVGGVGRYRRECDEVAARGYEGFEIGTREGART